MSDRELLELAARAAGFEYWTTKDHDRLMVLGHDKLRRPWDPLTDDGDALRLAVKLKLDVSGSLAFGNFRYVCNDGDTYAELDTNHYAATRRAIVRAAAEIGRQMHEVGAK